MVAPATALVLAAVVGMVGLVGDVGVWFAQRRELQTVTDAAALASAYLAPDASAVRTKAGTILQANGLDPTATLTKVETGYYCQDSSIAAASRFQASACASDPSPTPTPNAVRLSTKLTGASVLSGLFTTTQTISLSSTAARINQAGMEAGTGVLDLNIGMVNAALNALVGGSGINLTLVQYQGLATAHVDTLAFLDALAAKANISVGTYNDLLQSQVSVANIIDAAVQVLGSHSEVAGASIAAGGLQLIEGQIPGAPTIKLGSLIDLGLWKNLQIGRSLSAPAALDAGLNVYQLLTFALQLANTQNGLTIPQSTLGVSGLAGLTIQATAIEPPTKAYFAYGQTGLTIHSASARVKMSLNVLNLGSILGNGVQVPLYIEVAGGDAKLTGISCNGDPKTDTVVNASARGGLTDIYLGNVASNAMTNFSTPVTVSPFSILSLGILNLVATNITAKAHVGVGSASSAYTTLTFVEPTGTVTTGATPTTTGFIGRSASDPRGASAPIPARAYSQNIGTALLDGLADSLQVADTTCVIIIGCSQELRTGSAVGALLTTLDPVLSLLDGPIDTLLQSLGINVGYIDVFVTGAKCGQPVLIQ